MTNEQTIHVLIIGLCVALATGFLIGYGMHEEPHSPQQACQGAEQTKAAMEEVKSCYALLATTLAAKEQKETAH